MNGLLPWLKNPISIWTWWAIRKMWYEVKFRQKRLRIHYMARFSNCVFGKYNVLYDEVVLSDVSIGDYSYIAHRSRLSRVTIGKFSCIGPEVFAGLGKHPSRDFVSIHPFFYSPNRFDSNEMDFGPDFDEFEQINIGNDVWIGARAIILDGVSIGDGAIVAAGAVVVKNVPAYAVVGGVPAKLLRHRFSGEEIERLKLIRWWDKDAHWLSKNASKFRNIQAFLKSDLSNVKEL